jgi:enediyne biosynthesis protein E4
VRLRGPSGNPAAFGARIELLANGVTATRVREITAGSGYLSQSSPVAWFTKVPAGAKLRVRWPDGASTEHALERTVGLHTISR